MKMKAKYLYIIITILVLIIVSLLSYEKSSELVYKENKTKSNLNFGILDRGDLRKHEYYFKYVNKLYDSLMVYSVIDGCDCTRSSVKRGQYLRYDTVKIKIMYDPKKYKDSGNVKKTIYLVTNKTLSEYDTILPLTLEGYVKY